jgi:hypothetical protein
MKEINFEEIKLKKVISSRGGGIEINLTTLGFKGEKMSVYQNYLGGGMLGRICENNTINAYNKVISSKKQLKLEQIAEELKKYFHSLTNPEEGEWESVSYEQNQGMSISAY